MAGAKGCLSSRYGLYRDGQRGWIAGVCAGIAERLDIKPLWIRLGFAALAINLHAIPAVILYVVLVLTMRQRQDGAPPSWVRDNGRPGAPPGGPWQPPSGTRPPPPMSSGILPQLRARFEALDGRLNQIEAAVMSDEMSLRRKFKDLGG